MGYNDYDVTHPFLNKLGYGFKRIHSEVAVILPFRNSMNALKGMDLVNIRVNSLQEVKISKPCKICYSWIKMVGFKNVYYTLDGGGLEII